VRGVVVDDTLESWQSPLESDGSVLRCSCSSSVCRMGAKVGREVSLVLGMMDTELILPDHNRLRSEGGAAASALISLTDLVWHAGRQHKKRAMSLHCPSSWKVFSSICLMPLGALGFASLFDTCT